MNKRVSAFVTAGLAAVVIGTSATVGAWNGRDGHGPHGFGGPPDAAAMVERMTEHLGLTSDQASKVTATFEAQKAKVEALHTQVRDADEKMRTATAQGAFDESTVRSLATAKAQAMAELDVERARTQAAIYAVLTPEQRAQVDAMESRRGQFAGKGFGPGRRPMH